ncbi:MAG: elongation factor P [Candidatus Portnoybacteria bacterium]|nr:elongation factor P [Candidatus Portnoybacteria bacterium]
MINYNELKPGTIFILDGDPYMVLDYNFLRMQQRKPVAQTKIKNLITGKIIDRTFYSNDSFEEADIQKEKVTFIYSHRDKFVFSYENNPQKRFELSAEQIGDNAKFLKTNTIIEAMIFKGSIFNINLPIKMDFEVTEAPPAIRGNTASGGNKVVTIETGAKINAPLFIETRDIIRVNTQTGEYGERIEKAN